MHPLLTTRRLALYLLAWTPVIAMLAAASRAAGAPVWARLAVYAPACVLFAFVCLSPWQICRARPLTPANAVGLAVTFTAAGFVGGCLLAGAAAAIAYSIGQPAIVSGNLAAALVAGGTLAYLLSAGVHYTALGVEASLQADKRIAEAKTLAREAELQALRLQINPHFLFNSLHSISALATLDGARAREMCLRLAEFLRSSLGLGGRELIPLRDELALARAYLDVERVRFGDRLQVEMEIAPECEECAVPALLLQPLVENAVKHGIGGLIEGGAIRLAASRSDGKVSITVRNPFDPEMPAPAQTGLGLENVRRRLRVRYGTDASMQAGPREGVYVVELRLPCESPMASMRRA